MVNNWNLTAFPLVVLINELIIAKTELYLSSKFPLGKDLFNYSRNHYSYRQELILSITPTTSK